MKELVFPPRWHPVPPAYLEGEKRKGPFEVSVNELNSFQRCRRAWEIQSPNRLSLHRIGMPVPALHIGSAVHYALSALGLGGDPIAAVLIFYQQSVDTLEQQFQERVGVGLGDEEWEVLQLERDQVLAMVRAYVDRYGRRFPTRPYRIVAPEVTFRVPLVPDYDIYLVGTIDRVHVDQFGNPVVGECKTYKAKPKKVSWRFNHQIYGYAAALEILTGQQVPMALYDGVRKKAPTEPKILKNGTVSTAWIDTTHAVYKRKLLEVYGDPAILRHPAYADLLARLKNRDISNDSAFHTRFRVPISRHALELWWDQAQVIAMEMAHSPIIYPNFEWQGCPMCRIRDLCHAIQAGDDIDPMLEDFAVGQTHTRQAKIVATPENVTSLADIERFAGSLDPDRPFDIKPAEEDAHDE
jgi:PD-(D/E)XK nuclease superfamily